MNEKTSWYNNVPLLLCKMILKITRSLHCKFNCIIVNFDMAQHGIYLIQNHNYSALVWCKWVEVETYYFASNVTLRHRRNGKIIFWRSRFGTRTPDPILLACLWIWCSFVVVLSRLDLSGSYSFLFWILNLNKLKSIYLLSSLLFHPHLPYCFRLTQKRWLS